jgi:hypothetical protein
VALRRYCHEACANCSGEAIAAARRCVRLSCCGRGSADAKIAAGKLTNTTAVSESSARAFSFAMRGGSASAPQTGRWCGSRSTGLVRGAPARCQRGGHPYGMFTPDGPAPHNGVEGAGRSRHKAQCWPHRSHPAAPRSRRDKGVFEHGRGSNATRRQPVAHVRNGHIHTGLISHALLRCPCRVRHML